MSDPFAVARGRLGATVRNASYGKAERAEFTRKAREARRTNLEARVIAQYGLDPAAPDFTYRLKEGVSAHYRSMRLARVKAR